MSITDLLIASYWVVQGIRHGKFLSNLAERLGVAFPAFAKLPAGSTGAIWIHAVSVGEALSGITLARRLKEAYSHPPLIISTPTQTAQSLSPHRMSLPAPLTSFPFDLPLLLP